MLVPGRKLGWPLSADADNCLIAEVVSKPGAVAAALFAPAVAVLADRAWARGQGQKTITPAA